MKGLALRKTLLIIGIVVLGLLTLAMLALDGFLLHLLWA